LLKKTLQNIESGSRKSKPQPDFTRNRFIKLVKGVTTSSGYKKFNSKNFEKIKKFDICESLHCTINADEVHIRENLGLLKNYAISTETNPSYEKISTSVLAYLDFIESHWDELINE